VGDISVYPGRQADRQSGGFGWWLVCPGNWLIIKDASIRIDGHLDKA
jgi:hypothetical protein